ncbi:glycosyltransferase family 8 protein, partial [Spirosoma jeollabukense]
MPTRQHLPLVTICDEAFALLLAALLKSIEVNLTTSAHFELYLVDDQLRPPTRAKLRQAINPAVFTVHWLSLQQALPPNIVLPRDRSGFPLNVFVRLFIPYFIPPHLTRVVYLDVDMIAQRDITPLWTLELGHHPLGAVLDRAETVSSSWGGYANYTALGLAPETKVFNSGLLVIDPIRWRQEGLTQQILRCIEEHVNYAVFPDQYGLNVVLANRWQPLDRRWNCYAPSDEAHPYLIHFIGTKPIYTSYRFNQAYQAEFYRYLGLTPWQGYVAQEGWQRLVLKQSHKLRKRCSRLVHRLMG